MRIPPEAASGRLPPGGAPPAAGQSPIRGGPECVPAAASQVHAQLPQRPVLLSRLGWSAFVLALLVVCAVAPLLNLVVPAGSAFHMSDYAVALVGKIMCYAIAALAMDLIWGYTGILSLGHGLFFALGGYVMGMYLMRQIG